MRHKFYCDASQFLLRCVAIFVVMRQKIWDFHFVVCSLIRTFAALFTKPVIKTVLL